MREEMSMVRTWAVSSLHDATMTVTATSWMAALASVLERRGALETIERMAFERQRNGTIIANDLTGQRRYTIEQVNSVFTTPPGNHYLEWMVDGLSSIH